MRTSNITVLSAITFFMLAAVTPTFGQAPTEKGKGDGAASPKPKQATDEFRAILKEVEEAYKAPLEVDKDVLDELRKQYRNPTPERELKIFKEIRRLYDTTPALEEAILREIRQAYVEPSAEQEFRVIQAMRRGGQLPLGTVPVSIQAEQAAKLFRKLDQDGDGLLSSDEMPDSLRAQRAMWDADRDGTISFDEYGPYYQGHLKWVSAGVAAGEIPLRLPKAAAIPETDPASAEQPRTTVIRAGNLPAGLPGWFSEYDVDKDGQVGLYEWKKAGKPIAEFLAMDANNDGFLEAKELLAYLAKQPAAKTASTNSR